MNLYLRKASGSGYWGYYCENPDTERSKIALHPGSHSLGCISVPDATCWSKLESALRKQSRESLSVTGVKRSGIYAMATFSCDGGWGSLVVKWRKRSPSSVLLKWGTKSPFEHFISANKGKKSNISSTSIAYKSMHMCHVYTLSRRPNERRKTEHYRPSAWDMIFPLHPYLQCDSRSIDWRRSSHFFTSIATMEIAVVRLTALFFLIVAKKILQRVSLADDLFVFSRTNPLCRHLSWSVIQSNRFLNGSVDWRLSVLLLWPHQISWHSPDRPSIKRVLH